MKTKRLFIVTAIVLLAVCLLAACGPTDPTGSGDYTITFDYNYEGAPANGTQTVAEGDVVTPPSDPTRDKFGFTGWYTDAACTEKADFEYAVTEDATYYAGWVQTEATVTFDANWADGTDTAVNVEIGGTVTQRRIRVYGLVHGRRLHDGIRVFVVGKFGHHALRGLGGIGGRHRHRDIRV